MLYNSLGNNPQRDPHPLEVNSFLRVDNSHFDREFRYMLIAIKGFDSRFGEEISQSEASANIKEILEVSPAARADSNYLMLIEGESLVLHSVFKNPDEESSGGTFKASMKNIAIRGLSSTFCATELTQTQGSYNGPSLQVTVDRSDALVRTLEEVSAGVESAGIGVYIDSRSDGSRQRLMLGINHDPIVRRYPPLDSRERRSVLLWHHAFKALGLEHEVRTIGEVAVHSAVDPANKIELVVVPGDQKRDEPFGVCLGLPNSDWVTPVEELKSRLGSHILTDIPDPGELSKFFTQEHSFSQGFFLYQAESHLVKELKRMLQLPGDRVLTN